MHGHNPEENVFIAAFSQDPLANSIAVIVLLGMIASVVSISIHFIKNDTKNRLLNWPKWALPAFSVAGLAVAVYMSYVEVTRVEAVCGPVGDCNRVQESPYAYLFGVIPVGLLGVAGYLAILASWAMQQYGPKSMQKSASVALWAMTWFGMAFSIYLTFLEPFVIGATCAWCISSAILMTLVFWSSSKAAIESLQIDDEDSVEDDE